MVEIENLTARHFADGCNIAGSGEGNAVWMILAEQDWRQRTEGDALRVVEFGLDARQLLAASDTSRAQLSGKPGAVTA